MGRAFVAAWACALGAGLSPAAAQGSPLPVGVPFRVPVPPADAASPGGAQDRAVPKSSWAQGPLPLDVGELRAVSFARPDPAEQVRVFGPFEFEPFDECLPSWNVAHGRDTGFGVELAVARNPAGPFSPWMWIGEWNVAARPPELLGSFEDGQVDVDTFTSKSSWRALRLRVRLRSAAGDKPRYSIDRLTLMPTLRAARIAVGAAGSPAPLARLPVPFRSQRAEDAAIASRLCSPTSVSMVLAYGGVPAPTAEVARRSYDPFHDIYGNWNRAVQAAYSFGVPGRLERIPHWKRAEELLRQGSPLVVSIAAKKGQLTGAPYESTAGHLLVLCGFDERGRVLVNDPAAAVDPAGRQGLLAYERSQFEAVWLARGGTAYVLEARPPSGR